MKWRTTINVKWQAKMTYKDRFFFIGSCFSENIAEKMKLHGFHTMENPLGIMYNPASIHQGLKYLIDQEKLASSLFLERENHTYHYDMHSSVFHSSSSSSSSSSSDLQELMNRKLIDYRSFIQDKKEVFYVFITLGSAWVFEHRETGRIVANCHKQEAKLFHKRLMTQEEINDQLNSICAMSFPKNTQFIWTVSPIRHTKNGLVDNNISKARLLNAVYDVVEGKSNCHYFPSFEIMMDDLRDYRFYSKDLIHPNDQAIDYIWSLFVDNGFSEETKQTMKTFYKLTQMSNHRPLFPDSESSKKFVNDFREQCIAFSTSHPDVIMESLK